MAHYLIVLEEKPLFIGLLVYILASLGCAFVSDIDTFIGLRFIQAVGSCATVAAIAMVRDLFPVKKFQSTLFADVSCRAPMCTYYWRLRNSGYGWRCFLNFNGYWYCGSIGLSFGLPHTLNQILRFR
jgi:DHA1 family bicyclomycin/chloramphenicol resistance-like MFS transporter